MRPADHKTKHGERAQGKVACRCMRSAPGINRTRCSMTDPNKNLKTIVYLLFFLARQWETSMISSYHDMEFATAILVTHPDPLV